jgi:hypothetical protein
MTQVLAFGGVASQMGSQTWGRGRGCAVVMVKAEVAT